MTTFPRGPYLIEIPMVFNELSHSLTFNCDILGTPAPGDAPSSISFRTRGSVAVTVEDGVNAAWAELRQLFNATTLAATYTLWKTRTTNNNLDFVSAGTLTLANGSGVAANIPASQLTMTWRSAAGNTMRVNLLEHNVPGSSRVPIAAAGNVFISSFNDYVLSDDNWISARDRSFPVAALNASFGQNEKVFNRRYRS